MSQLRFDKNNEFLFAQLECDPVPTLDRLFTNFQQRLVYKRMATLARRLYPTYEEYIQDTYRTSVFIAGAATVHGILLATPMETRTRARTVFDASKAFSPIVQSAQDAWGFRHAVTKVAEGELEWHGNLSDKLGQVATDFYLQFAQTDADREEIVSLMLAGAGYLAALYTASHRSYILSNR